MKVLPSVSFTALLLCLVIPSSAQLRGVENTKLSAERRIALVVGNSAYERSPLLNPVNDARDIAQVLSELKFEVIYKANLGYKDMKAAIREFGAQMKSGEVGLFYYAGHAVQVGGRNYLVPVDARIKDEAEVAEEAIDVSLVLTQMKNAQSLMNILILDACRNNPFPQKYNYVSKSLVPMDAPPGTLIAYASAPGAEAWDGRGRNGVYTRELLKSIRTAGLSIEEVFKNVRVSVQRQTMGKQTPWESSSLTGDFFFRTADENWAEGMWEGTAYQSTPNTVWPLKLVAQNNKFLIEYPSRTCVAELILTNKKNGQATFREINMNGSNRCADGGEVVLEKVSGAQLIFKYLSPQSSEIVASAILNKKEFKAQAQRVMP
ncbi:MAG: caspase family protein [Acidobacteria bacterium]|nr:caspase family protein [Acidobacteriota bacterium]